MALWRISGGLVVASVKALASIVSDISGSSVRGELREEVGVRA